MNSLVGKCFLHGISLDNWHVCWNLKISNKLSSADPMGEFLADPGEHQKIREASVDLLSEKKIPIGFIQPRLMGAYFSEEKWKMEVLFEKYRREIAPFAPSRLSCLYLAENSEKGESFIKDILPSTYICKVKVVYCTRFARVDARWVDEFWNNKSIDAIKKYWLGTQFSEDGSSWEYLLDGIIEFENKDQLEFIRRNGRSALY